MFNKEVGMNKTAPISRRGLLATAAFAAVMPLVVGCTAGGGGGGGAAGEKTTITVMTGAQDLTAELIADFEAKNPNIKVNHILTDPARLNTMLAAGNPPDIATGGAVGSANNNARGLATDLTPFLEKSTVLKQGPALWHRQGLEPGQHALVQHGPVRQGRRGAPQRDGGGDV
jgi:multiple sugar transport system substrate-binding protein